ncbi:DUF2169 family type VI secretion system accessory protein [Nannocystaceae bacterium ST9]
MALSAITTNLTPFVAGHFLLPDGEGGEVVLVLVKATLDLDAQGEPTIAEQAVELCLVDEFRGEPGRTSPRRDTDLILAKPRVDVLVEGWAHAPQGRACERTMIELHVGELHKRVRVTGDRVWIDAEASAPEPFEALPLGWERAYGGMLDREHVDERNPLGIGHHGARSADPDVASWLPNFEDPDAPMLHPGSVCAPVGLGVVGRAWLPRRPLAGTFDFAWKRERWPLAPRDFDPAFHQSAPLDQQLEGEIGGELVRLVNLTPEGEWSFRVPRLAVPIHFVHADRLVHGEARVDTLEIDAARRQLILTGRATIPVVRRRPPLIEIVVGHAPLAWLDVRRSGWRGEPEPDASRGYLQ